MYQTNSELQIELVFVTLAACTSKKMKQLRGFILNVNMYQRVLAVAKFITVLD